MNPDQPGEIFGYILLGYLALHLITTIVLRIKKPDIPVIGVILCLASPLGQLYFGGLLSSLLYTLLVLVMLVGLNILLKLPLVTFAVMGFSAWLIHRRIVAAQDDSEE